ncbi:hypothetical protein C8039_19870 [Halogeometricum sp. wsp3]|nr:hypothetical protein C8039_19870 [Halogeometricum sp. wsp3]
MSTLLSTRKTRGRAATVALEADPDADFHQFGVERMPKVPLDVYQTPDEKGSADVGTSKAKSAKAFIDATTDGDATDTTATAKQEGPKSGWSKRD